VTALVRTQDQARAIAEYGVRPQVGDLLDRESVRRGMRRTDGVFHCAAWHRLAGRRYAKVAQAVNVIGTRNVLEIMRDLSIPRGVYTSGLLVHGNTRGQVVDEGDVYEGRHFSVVGRTKWEAHYRVALPMIRNGLPLTIVMPGVVYGPGDTSSLGAMLGRHLRGRVPVVPSKTAFCWAHASDVGWGHLMAMERGRPGQTYVMCGPAHTLTEVFGIAGRMIGRRRDPLPLPRPVLRAAASVLAVLRYPVPPLGAPAERLRSLAGVTQLGDDSRARRELGFDPRPLQEGLPDAVRALLEELMDEVK
jgi:nucleoside-diphosphate-sugar epimerase